LESKCVAIETFQKLNSINAFNSGWFSFNEMRLLECASSSWSWSPPRKLFFFWLFLGRKKMTQSWNIYSVKSHE
jgi:hypothetical protein